MHVCVCVCVYVQLVIDKVTRGGSNKASNSIIKLDDSIFNGHHFPSIHPVQFLGYSHCI